jgi:3-oxoacyl-(acyl-carrier-protein) synthase
MSEIVVTGIGIVSGLGSGKSATLQSLLQHKTGVRKPLIFQSKYAQSFYFGEVDLSDEAIKELLDIPIDTPVNRTNLLAELAFKEAIQDANLTANDFSSFRLGAISASTVGGMCNTDALYSDANKLAPSSPFLRSYEGSNHLYEIAKKYKIKGFTDVINTACSSSANAIMLGTLLLKTGRLDKVIVGGVDSLAKYTVNGFNSLRILDENWCKPFDTERAGLNLGEGAAYLVLERREDVQNKHIHAVVAGYSNKNDAFHPSATSDDAKGPILVMKEALSLANMKPSAIDYINAHGTGTPNNDVTELFAFNSVFENLPPYSSTKSYTGHTLAAAGSIEAVISILAIQSNTLFGGLNNTSPMDLNNVQLQKNQSHQEIRNVMSNSFGFGGNCTSLIFSKS